MTRRAAELNGWRMTGLVLAAWMAIAGQAAVGRIAAEVAAQDGGKSPGEGFVSLFDGKTLKGWTGATDAYKVENGAIVCQTGTDTLKIVRVGERKKA